MLKKLALVLIILAALVFTGVNVVAQRAPAHLRSSLQRAIGKQIKIKDIRYSFPATFELTGFEILEDAPFAGERAFAVDELRLNISPLSLNKKALIIDKVEVDGAEAVIRKIGSRSHHGLSSMPRHSGSSDPAPVKASNGRPRLPLVIHQFHLKNSRFRFIDYDIDKDGFVIQLDDIDANVKNIMFPAGPKRTQYVMTGDLAQGRAEQPGDVKVVGWTSVATFDTDASIEIEGLFIPYFRPYYAPVTPATIENGFIDSRAAIVIKDQNLTLAVDVQAREVLFGAYESGDQLFGLKADQVLPFLLDPSSGRLKFQFQAEWPLNDPNVKTSKIIRSAIEKSIKAVVLENLAPILARKMLNAGEQGSSEATKGIEKNIEKVKDFLKF